MTYHEFCEYMGELVSDASKKAKGDEEERIKKMFKTIDANGDDMITENELKKAMEELLCEEVDDDTMKDLMTFDKDGDGLINLAGKKGHNCVFMK